jgi:ribonuclease HI
MNWDVAFQKSSRSMGEGVVLRDEKGEGILAVAQFLPQVTDPSMAKVVALWKAVQICGELGYTKVVFEGNSLLITESLNQCFPCLKNYGQIIEDTRVVLKSFHFFTVQHVKRGANQAAHMLATLALSQLINCIWRGACPSVIHHIVMTEQVSS